MGVALFSSWQMNKIYCTQDQHDQNKLGDRYSYIQYPGNHPIEDRWVAFQLTAIDGYLVIVIDGHRGWQMSEYVKNHIAREIDASLIRNRLKAFENEDEYIKKSLEEAFDNVEYNFLSFAREADQYGFPQPHQVGAACLAALIHNNKLYAANAGDCKGVIISENEGKFEHKKINREFNAMSKKEQQRLKENFPAEQDDIYHCKHPDSCYVKHRLQLTRTFGDFYLKYPEFNNPKDLDRCYGYLGRLKTFSGPYLTHKPEIRIFNITNKDKFLVLSSDGMWDELTKNEVAEIVGENSSKRRELPEILVNKALFKAAQKNNITEEELRKIPVQKRRSTHDDMTVLVVDLQNPGSKQFSSQ